jgi:hypothetical protein
MYEHFTSRARKAMQLANQEAHRMNHDHLGTEHILLGLVKEGSGVAASVLKDRRIDLPKIRVQIEKIVRTGPDIATPGKLPPTPRAKNVIAFAIEEVRSLNQDHVGTEHILLGLLREKEGAAAQVLLNLGVNFDALRKRVLRKVQPETCARQFPNCAWLHDPAARWLAAKERRFFENAPRWVELRVAFGGVVGAIVGAMVFGTDGAFVGLVLGCLAGALNWFTPAVLLGSLAGAVAGEACTRNDAGALAGSALGTMLAALILQRMSLLSQRRAKAAGRSAPEIP